VTGFSKAQFVTGSFMTKIRTHKDLDVWNLAIDFTVDIYRSTKDFPQSELYGLVSQLRRAAVSISSNIAEGAARKSKKEFAHFLYHSLGSSSEIETQLIVAQQLDFLDSSKYDMLSSKQAQISKMLINLIRSLHEEE
jgi:four helix bundle protein